MSNYFHYLVTVGYKLGDVPSAKPPGFSYERDITFIVRVPNSVFPKEDFLLTSGNKEFKRKFEDAKRSRGIIKAISLVPPNFGTERNKVYELPDLVPNKDITEEES